MSRHREPPSDHQLVLAQDKVFRNALRNRRTGIIMASVGLSLGLLLIVLGSCLMGFPLIGAPVIGLGISCVSTAGPGALFWWDGQSTIDEMRAARSASPELTVSEVEQAY